MASLAEIQVLAAYSFLKNTVILWKGCYVPFRELKILVRFIWEYEDIKNKISMF